MAGFVTLLGITLRNSSMLISHYEHLVYAGQLAWNVETAVRGALERLMPILMTALMTALVTALDLPPLAVTSDAPGNEMERPMAIVILGSVIKSTALDLSVLPTLALHHGRFARDELAEPGPSAAQGEAGANL